MTLQAQLVKSDMVAHFSTADYCLCSRDHTVFQFDYHNGQWRKICQLPPAKAGFIGLLKDKIARSSLYRRLQPTPGLSHLTQTPDGTIVIVYDRIYLCKPSGETRSAMPLVSDLGRFAPPLRNGMAVEQRTGLVYFGEYLNNHSRDVRVICIDPVLDTARVCWQFSRQQIKHIHAIVYDPFRQRLWITTGDNDAESAFYYTDDGFASVHKFAGGDQTWRATGLLFDETGMEWGMDAGKDAPADAVNYIWRWDFATASRTQRCTIGNPAYAVSSLDNGGAVLTTTYEPGRLQDTPEQSALWYRSPAGDWQQIYAQDYQYRAMPGVSKYGMLYIAQGTIPAAQLLFSPVNCRSGQFGIFRLPPL